MLEENNIIERIQKGEKDLISIIVNNNIGLVYMIVNEYKAKNCEYKDLISCCKIGLIEAIYKYDSKMNTKFCTYSSYYIRNNIISFIKHNMSKLHIPRNVYDEIFLYRKKLANYYKTHSKLLTYEELAIELEMDVNDITIYERALKEHLYFNYDPVNLFEDEKDVFFSYEEIMNKSCEENIDEEVEKSLLSEYVEKVFDVCQIKKDDREIVKEYFGFYGEDKTLRELGEKYNISYETVRIRINKVIKKLNCKKSLELLKGYIDINDCNIEKSKIKKNK